MTWRSLFNSRKRDTIFNMVFSPVKRNGGELMGKGTSEDDEKQGGGGSPGKASTKEIQ